MICYECKKERGGVGSGVTLHRQGIVPDTHGMKRYIALCNECLKETTIKNKYHQASRGA